MCLILLSFKSNKEFPLIIGSNRDERHERPTADAGFWDDHPDLYAGRDLQDGGTWLGITTNGRISALTNYREPQPRRTGVRSRGTLVSDYLVGSLSGQDYLNSLAADALNYNPFNLIAGNLEELWYLSNRGSGVSPVTPGVHGLSNHLLDTPWPKVKLGCDTLNALDHCKDPDTIIETLLNTLADQRRAPITELPKTGVTLQLEKTLSPPFIMGDHYGTRNSMVVIVSASGEVFVHEKRFGPQARFAGETARAFKIR